MDLKPGEVHVWQARLNVSTVPFDSLLSPDERDRAARFKFDLHRQRFVAGRGILRSILARYLKIDPQALKFSYEPGGKPFLEERLQFNLAHSEDLALIAVTLDRPVGIDVEAIRSIENLEALTERFFTSNEYEAICRAQIEARSGLFFRYWTCKEAILKATGAGLSKLSGLEIKTLPDPDTVLDNWFLKEIPLNGDFVGAIAIASRNESLQFRSFFFN